MMSTNVTGKMRETLKFWGSLMFYLIQKCWIAPLVNITILFFLSYTFYWLAMKAGRGVENPFADALITTIGVIALMLFGVREPKKN